MKGAFNYMNKKKKYNPIPEEPEDNVGTIYCNEDLEEYNNAVTANDMFPYQSPLPKYRREPEPPII